MEAIVQEQKAGQLGGEALWLPRDQAPALPPTQGHDGAVGELGSKLLTAGLPQGAPWHWVCLATWSLSCRRPVQVV